jgi:hypothetical protein
MKNVFACSIALTALAASLSANAAVIAGPITNPANGHDYFLLSAGSWTASEAEAENLGGTLAIIRDAGDQEWVLSTFGGYGGTNRNLWIGLHRHFSGGPFVWVADGAVDFSNWENGQPDNNGGNEMYVHMLSKVGNRIPGTWNDLPEQNSFDGAPICGVVEVPGKADQKSLTEKEKLLIGTWYFGGDRGHPCWIAGTENKLFEIFDGRATRLMYTPEGPVLALMPQHGIYGEILPDRILWSNGTWWSREPANYGEQSKSSQK